MQLISSIVQTIRLIAHTKLLIFIAICFSLLLLSSQPVKANNTIPTATNGVIDLTDWNWDEDGIVSLDGQWEFYWQQLLTPENFRTTNIALKKDLIGLPRAWNYFEIDNEELTGSGYATYRLLIHHSSEQILAIKLSNIFTSYNLWIDGEFRTSNGNVATNRNDNIPQQLPKEIFFTPNSDTTEIIIQVANFQQRSGGLINNIYLGTDLQIKNLKIKNLAIELLLFASLFIIGFYHLVLYAFRTDDKSTLYFGLYAVLISLRTLGVGERFLIFLLPNLNWELLHTLLTLTFYIGVPLFFMFFKTIFPKDVPIKILRIVQFISFGFSLVVVLTPVKIFSHINTFFQLFTIVVMIYIFYILVIACIKKRESAYTFTVSAVILFVCIINDLLYNSVIFMDSNDMILRTFITTGNLSSWGLLIFVFTQALVLAKKFSNSFIKAAHMTEMYQQLNENLEQKVTKRTLALEASKKELETAYQEISSSEQALQRLIQNVSHDLRSPLTSIRGYVNTILDRIVSDPKQQQKYLERVKDKTTNLNHLVQQLVDLSNLESRQSPLESNSISVKAFIKAAAQKYRFDMLAEKTRFSVTYPLDWHDCTANYQQIFISVDTNQLDRVFTNLLNNAVNHSPTNVQINLDFQISEDRKNLVTTVSDTGYGIEKKYLPHLFERFYMVSKSRHSNKNNSGLGLAIAKEIIDYHGGQIFVESEVGHGSQFFFTLPIIQPENK